MTAREPFERVVAAHGTAVLRVCRALLDPHDADDAWSSTFLAAMQAYPALPDGSNVEGWLVTIAHRKAIDVLRARTRAPLPVEEPPEEVSTVGLPGSGDLDLAAAVRRLPEKQRRAVGYHYLGGLPYREVGALTDQSPEAARRSAADGVKALRRLLTTDGSEGASR